MQKKSYYQLKNKLIRKFALSYTLLYWISYSDIKWQKMFAAT